MPLYVLTILVTGPPEQVSAAAAEQRERLRDLHRGGKISLAGEFANDDGFLQILDVADRHEAEALTRDLPLVRAGLASWMLREWKRAEF
ncbi:MAG: hypothetical protein GY716_03350 [bacterium]|nr:hypothetical protein [bacterium]